MDLGVPSISAAPMARNTENPRFVKDGGWKKEHSPATMIFADLRVSTNFGVSNGKLGFEFLLPTSASKICHFPQAADLGVPPHFSGSDGQKHGNSKIFQGWLLETGALTGKSDDFRRFALTKCAVYIRPRVDLGVLLLLVGGDGGGGGAVVVGVVVVVREREKQREREREKVSHLCGNPAVTRGTWWGLEATRRNIGSQRPLPGNPGKEPEVASGSMLQHGGTHGEPADPQPGARRDDAQLADGAVPCREHPGRGRRRTTTTLGGGQD